MNNPFYVACSEGRLDEVERMLRAGANVHFADPWWKLTPLHAAATGHHVDVIVALLEHKADPNKADKKGQTPLLIAAGLPAAWAMDTIQALLKGGANVNQAANDGTTPLIIACVQGSLPCVRLLCEHGADINYVGYGNITAIEWANQSCHEPVALYLEERLEEEFWAQQRLKNPSSRRTSCSFQMCEFEDKEKCRCLNPVCTRGHNAHFRPVRDTAIANALTPYTMLRRSATKDEVVSFAEFMAEQMHEAANAPGPDRGMRSRMQELADHATYVSQNPSAPGIDTLLFCARNLAAAVIKGVMLRASGGIKGDAKGETLVKQQWDLIKWIEEEDHKGILSHEFVCLGHVLRRYGNQSSRSHSDGGGERVDLPSHDYDTMLIVMSFSLRFYKMMLETIHHMEPLPQSSWL